MEEKIGYRNIWSIAWPIILGSLAQNVITATDTAFLGRVGEIALGAAAIGGIFYLALTMFGWGFGIGTQIIVARRFGEGNREQIGAVIQHALWFLLPMALLMFFVIHTLSPIFLKGMLHSDQVYHASKIYLKYRSFGIFFAFTNMVFRALYIGIGRTRIITWSTLVMAFVNIILDYVLVFGKFGFPELGIEGAAIASALAELAALSSFILYSLRDKDLSQLNIFKFAGFKRSIYLNNISVAGPVMFQNFFSISVWFLFFVIVENLGEHSLAISNIIRSIYVIMLLPMWGLASATNTLVSMVIGRGSNNEVMKVAHRTAALSFLSVGMVVGLILLFPKYVLNFYTNSQSLMADSLPVLFLVSGSALIISIAFIYFNAVSGTGKTRISLLIESGVLSLYLIYSYSLARFFHAHVTMMWTAEYVYGTMLLVLSMTYLLSKKWVGSKV